jgi:acyl-CoA synthetase (AMP-forming)/AMP-acid ligase II/acyl carrier protein
MSSCVTPTVDSPFPGEESPGTLVDLLGFWAAQEGRGLSYRFLRSEGGDDSLSFAELDHRARQIALSLAELTRPGDRVLLVYPAGLDFVCGFFGCLYAGVLAVPATYPKPRRPMPRLSAIAADCGATVALTTASTWATLDLPRVAPELESLHWLATDALPAIEVQAWCRPRLRPDDLAFLQYTSGSTSEPKGVMVSHANLLHNLETIRQGFGIQRSAFGDEANTGVFWLPAYHDMGLIGGILMPLYVGGRSVLMSPTSFLQRPYAWLRAISDYQAVVSGAPNFGYDLCVRKITPEQRQTLDLESWQLAFCGAEPIRPETLESFSRTFASAGLRPQVFYPCYGLAESTLLAAGGDGPDELTIKAVRRSSLANHRLEFVADDTGGDVMRLVGCGTGHGGQELLIVDPESRQPSGPGEVGEIWLRGPSVARGYWNRPEESALTFAAWLADGTGPWLKSGDLGFVADGQLYVTGRAKDVIILRGRNHYPQDLEHSVEQAHPLLRPGAGAAFALDVDGEERLVVVHEVDRACRNEDLREVAQRIRVAVAEDHEVEPYAVVLIRQASLPVTTSGKVQRSLCREQYQAGQLRELLRWFHPGQRPRRAVPAPLPEGQIQAAPLPAADPALPRGPLGLNGQNGHAAVARPAALAGPSLGAGMNVDRLAERIETWLIDWLVDRAGVPRHEMDRLRPFAEYGLDSLTAVELSQELEDWLSVPLAPVLAWNYPTPAALAQYLAQQVSGPPEAAEAAGSTAPADGGFEQLLSEIESLSDHDALSSLSRDQPAL